MQPQSLDGDPSHEVERSSDFYWTQSRHNTYYSNGGLYYVPSSRRKSFFNLKSTDIAILHSIVTAAQSQLVNAPEPKPLPAAVLFKAYDAILPAFGIDADADHHLSAFIFRIGGEDGSGTLLQKFQTILSRMGIVLEFGDDSSISSAKSPSPPLPTLVPSSKGQSRHHQAQPSSETYRSGSGHRGRAALELNNWDGLTSNAGESHRNTNGPQDNRYALKIQTIHRKNATSTERAPGITTIHKHLHPTSDSSSRNHPYSKLLLEAILADSRGEKVKSMPAGQQVMVDPAVSLDCDRMVAEGLQSPSEYRAGLDGEKSHNNNNERYHSTSQQPSQDFKLHSRKNSNTFQYQPEILSPGAHGSATSNLPFLANTRDLTMTVADGVDSYVLFKQSRFFRCAIRASQIYLASKIFNCWANRATIKLEREAVAKRHMIRFRCFHGWSKAPTSKAHVADHLKAVTAARKLRRLVMCQKEQLCSAAAFNVGAHWRKGVEKALQRWTGQVIEQEARLRSAKRVKLAVIKQWRRRAWGTTESEHTSPASNHSHYIERRALIKWCSRAHNDSTQLDRARRVGEDQLLLHYMKQWLEGVELIRRSLEFRRFFMLNQLIAAFFLWNISARAQAFRWRIEYLSVQDAFELWLRRTHEDHQANSMAYQHHETRSKAIFQTHLLHEYCRATVLKDQNSRARLYLNGMRVLQVLKQTVAQRKGQLTSSIRQHLRAKYTLVSSARKRRNFLTALDHWRVVTNSAIDKTQLIRHMNLAAETRQLLRILASWQCLFVTMWEPHSDAKAYRRKACLELWSQVSARYELHDAQALGLWSSRKRRDSFKAWSIATLRRSGQAHTAYMVQQKYHRESLCRVLLRWRTRGNAIKQGLQTYHLRKSQKLEPAAGQKNATVSGRGRRHDQYANQSLGLVETPSRWTGLPVPPMQRLSSKRMTSVKRPGNRSLKTTNAIVETPSWQESRSEAQFRPSFSTTPKAPPPANFKFSI